MIITIQGWDVNSDNIVSVSPEVKQTALSINGGITHLDATKFTIYLEKGEPVIIYVPTEDHKITRETLIRLWKEAVDPPTITQTKGTYT